MVCGALPGHTKLRMQEESYGLLTSAWMAPNDKAAGLDWTNIRSLLDAALDRVSFSNLDAIGLFLDCFRRCFCFYYHRMPLIGWFYTLKRAKT